MSLTNDPKTMARLLRARMKADGLPIQHSHALELVAASLGFRDWNTCAAGLATPNEPITTPILRTFPGPEAHRFYVEYLGFVVDWEHRFADGMPLYQQISKDGAVLHLSEHHGDATPGSAVRILVRNVRELQRHLAASTTYPLRIGLQDGPGGVDVTIPDPFGNRVIFFTPEA